MVHDPARGKPHDRTVALRIFRPVRERIITDPVDRSPRRATDIERGLGRGHEPIVQPPHEVLADVREVIPTKPLETLRHAERHRPVIGPISGRSSEAAARLHVRHILERPAFAELHGGSESVPNDIAPEHSPHPPVFFPVDLHVAFLSVLSTPHILQS